MRKEIAMLAVVSAMYPIHNEATPPLTIVMMSKERNLLRQLTSQLHSANIYLST